jgi:hypothetical protein
VPKQIPRYARNDSGDVSPPLQCHHKPHCPGAARCIVPADFLICHPEPSGESASSLRLSSRNEVRDLLLLSPCCHSERSEESAFPLPNCQPPAPPVIPNECEGSASSLLFSAHVNPLTTHRLAPRTCLPRRGIAATRQQEANKSCVQRLGARSFFGCRESWALSSRPAPRFPGAALAELRDVSAAGTRLKLSGRASRRALSTLGGRCAGPAE